MKRIRNVLISVALAALCTAFRPAAVPAATVQVWITDSATGLKVEGAHFVALAGADTLVRAVSGTASPLSFQVDASAVNAGRSGLMPKSASVLAFPNPCRDKVSLDWVSAGSGERIEVFDVLGRRLYAGPSPSAAGRSVSADFGLTGLPDGLYLVRISGGNGMPATGKFMKTGGAASLADAAVRRLQTRIGMPKPSAPARPDGKSVRLMAYTTKTAKDAEGRHVCGYASVETTVSGDTLITIPMSPQPFSEAGHNAAPGSAAPVIVDGRADDPVWGDAAWGDIDHVWLGAPPAAEDFTGRYKIAWTPERLCLLVEIRDDAVSDQYPDPLSNYWQDDCVEVFIDENASGGNHQYSYNAFAYHVALNGTAVDAGADGRTKNLSDHMEVARIENGDICTWEIAIRIFGEDFSDTRTDNVPLTLETGKVMGFMVAYCDNDGTYDRQNFVGSIFIAGRDKNVGWINASVFGTLELVP